MTHKLIVLITGANKGLGYYSAEILLRTGNYHVLLGSRDLGRAEKAIQDLTAPGDINAADITAVQFDSDSDESIKAAATKIEKDFSRLDILMLNGATMLAAGSTRSQWTQIYNTNLFGNVVAVETFLPLLRNSTSPGGKRIALTSSEFGSLKLTQTIERLCPKDLAMVNAYRSSKSALNMVMLCYTSMLQNEGFVVAASDPGYCATDMTSMMGYKDPREGAKVLVQAAVGSKEDVHGKLINEDGALPW